MNAMDRPIPTENIVERMRNARGFAEQGAWYPASGGTEEPFTSRGGHRLLYVWQPSTGRHAYLNLDTDIILTDEEARATLGTY